MRRRYNRFARNTYRFLRNRKRRRSSRFFGWLGSRVLDRALWKPNRNAVASGVAVGLAVSMLPPIPVQMLLAAMIAVLLRANIPMAAAGCWLSNPFTWAPLLYFQNRIGGWMLQPGAFEQANPGIYGVRCTALGVVVLAVIVAPIGYCFVYLLWDAVGWLAKKLAPATDTAVDKIDSKQKLKSTSSLAASRTEI